MSHNMTTIRIAEKDDQTAWDEYVLSHPDSSPYHLFAWKNAVEEAYGHKSYYMIAENEQKKIVGVLPLINLRLPLLLNELTALPFCDVGNCLSDSAAVEDGLLAELINISRELKCKKIKLRGHIRESDFLKKNFFPEPNKKVRMLLELPESSTALLAGFKSKLRSQIRKAEKNGVVFRWADRDGVDAFYAVFCQNMRDLGSPVHSRRWFQKVMDHFGAKARLGLAEYEGNCIGAGLILSTKEKTVIPWASTLSEYNRLAPNMLLYWNFLKFAADNAKYLFDFGRSTENEGTFKFKKQWGARPVPLVWYSQHPTSPSSQREMVADLWRKLPLSVANYAGPHLRKYISL